MAGSRPFCPVAPGDTVAVVAPAGPAPADRFEAGLASLRERYRVICDHDPATRPPAGLAYLAGSDEQRAGELDRAVRDERVRAVFCARGGYGCARIVDRLDGECFARRRIPLVGFSDVTALHAWAARLGATTVHGPLVTQLCDLAEVDHQALFSLLEQGVVAPVERLHPVSEADRSITATLVGGNLTVLSHLCGTRHMPPVDSALLLLEDVGEHPYRIDRMLTQLLQAGVFARVAGVVLGDFVRCEDHDADRSARPRVAVQDVIADRLGSLPIPVVGGAPVGHGQRNRALPLGATAHLDPVAGRLEIEPLLLRPTCTPASVRRP